MIQPENRSTPLPLRLELRDVALRFGRTRALDALSLEVRAGEIIALLGDSGCGKSTLLRAVAGLEHLDAGEIRLDDVTVNAGRNGVPPEARGVGLMFQDYALFPHLTVAENVRFGLVGRGRAEARAIAADRLAQVGLDERADDYPGTLSGGESQRVALARALAPEPRILLLDEPFSNLDRRTRDRVRADTLSVLRRTETTTLLVTHDPEEAMLMADRIALMRSGRIVQTGTAEELYRRPVSRFAARFFGPLIEWPGACRGGRVATPFGPIPAPGFAEGATLLTCIRPETVRIGRPDEERPGSDLPGRILARRFLGAHALLTVAVDGCGAPFDLPVPCTDAHAPGEGIRMRVPHDDILLFPRSADGVDRTLES